MTETQIAAIATQTNRKAGFLDKDGVAELLGFSRRHIDNLLAQGMPHMKFGKRRVRMDPIEVIAWCKDQFGTRRLGRATG